MFSGIYARSIRSQPRSPRDPRMPPISAGSPISRSSAKLARKTDRQKSGSQGSDAALARHATLAASRPLLGKRAGRANGMAY